MHHNGRPLLNAVPDADILCINCYPLCRVQGAKVIDEALVGNERADCRVGVANVAE